MKIFILTVFLSLLFINHIFPQSNQSNKNIQNSIGISFGIPYTSGLTYERTINQKFSIQGHAGYFVIISSLGLKVNWTPMAFKISPYFFLGNALINMEAQDCGDPDGISNYIWFGTGLSYSIKKMKVFVEFSGLVGGNDDKGIGDDWIFPFSPSVGGGVVYQF